MSANIVKAMEALAQYKLSSVSGYSVGYKIGINSVGSAFEYYIKDLLTGNIYSTQKERQDAYRTEFSWLGNQNFPPDAIAKDGDAFEIKKHEKPASSIALNSSPPRDRLSAQDSKLTSRSLQAFKGKPELDLFYIVGTVPGSNVKSIYFVQGTGYAAKPHIYESISTRLSCAILDSSIDFSKTKELGRVNKADPLGRASLRIRGMWQIMDPSRAFSDIAPPNPNKNFMAYAIMEAGKLSSMGGAPTGVGSKKVDIPDPNNPAECISAVVLEVSW